MLMRSFCNGVDMSSSVKDLSDCTPSLSTYNVSIVREISDTSSKDDSFNILLVSHVSMFIAIYIRTFPNRSLKKNTEGKGILI